MRPRCSPDKHEWWVILAVVPGELEFSRPTLDVECILCKCLGKVPDPSEYELSVTTSQIPGHRNRWNENSRVKDIREAPHGI